MDITLNNINELNAILKIKLHKEDYEPKVTKSLNKFRKTANIKGFRIGMAPIGMIKKMYGKGVMVEEINRLVSENLYKYITDSKIDILGEPIPSINEKSDVDFDNDEQTEFQFNFDLGLMPKINTNLEFLNDIPKYKIIVNEDLINKQVESYQYNFGQYIEYETIEDKCLVNSDLLEVDETTNEKENGLFKENASMLVEYIKDEEIKQHFQGKKVGDVLFVDIKKAYPNETDLAGMLGLKKEELQNVGSFFKVTINKIQKFVPSELNQELFDKAFGVNNITSEEQLRQKIKENYEKNFVKETEFKLLLDAKEKFLNSNIELPAEFLKRWLMIANQDKKITEEQLDKEFPQIEKDIKWTLVKNSFIKSFDIKVTEEDALETSKEILGYELTQYGITLDQFPAEQFETFAKERLNNKEKPEERNRIFERAAEQKFTRFLINKVNFEEKEVSIDEFQKFFEKDEVSL